MRRRSTHTVTTSEKFADCKGDKRKVFRLSVCQALAAACSLGNHRHGHAQQTVSWSAGGRGAQGNAINADLPVVVACVSKRDARLNSPRFVSRKQLAKKGSHTKLVIKLAEHSGTGLVVVEGGVEKDANDIKTMIQVIQVSKTSHIAMHGKGKRHQRC